jgi:hypothetical protein
MIRKSGELFTGIGFRKKWTNENYEGKITLAYEVGQKSGNGKSKSTIYGSFAPNGINTSSNTAGKTTQYLHLYGSILDLKNNFKFIPSVNASIQKRQKSISVSLKLEYRF